jgi:hypothetical protein
MKGPDNFWTANRALFTEHPGWRAAGLRFERACIEHGLDPQGVWNLIQERLAVTTPGDSTVLGLCFDRTVVMLAAWSQSNKSQ